MKQRFFDAVRTPAQHEFTAKKVEETVPEFNIPEKVRIRTRYSEDDIFVVTSGDVWRHQRYCVIDWRRCTMQEPVLGVFRRFIWYRLASSSPSTAQSNFDNVVLNQNHLNEKTFPWSEAACKSVLARLKNSRDAFLSFRLFYRWAALKGAAGFSREISSSLDDLAGPEFEPYRSVKLRDSVLTPVEEVRLLQTIDELGDSDDYFSFQDNVISHLSWELGCRPEQVAGIEHQHFSEVIGPSGAKFFQLKLIRVKQRSYKSAYRNRVISERLAIKIHKLIAMKHTSFGTPGTNQSLFITPSGKRITSATVRLAICDTFMQAEIRPGNSTLLRHNMAQKLADQGTPGDLISDMLDHTTKIAARHYVAATPEIATIKARALGKNATYVELMSMMTGALVRRDQIYDPRQIVKGMVATQYIGNIGACGLDLDTACNKNPIYSCYTCKKFHPFIDGDHKAVVNALRTEVQVLLDQSFDLPENKAVIQLERTIECVMHIEQVCSSLAAEDDNET